MRRYGSGTNAWISRSRLTISASVGVCTRPSETTPPTHARPRIVAARVAFRPTAPRAPRHARAGGGVRAEEQAGLGGGRRRRFQLAQLLARTELLEALADRLL